MKKYFKNGKECIFCQTRKKLIQVTPEEEVRQNFIRTLINDYGVPADLIETEIPLSYYQKGVKGRIDILVSELKDNSLLPLIIVECKAPTVPITDKVLDQAAKYDGLLQAKILALTNGTETCFFCWNDELADYKELSKMPTFTELLDNSSLEYKKDIKTKWNRPKHNEDLINVKSLLLKKGSLGLETDDKLVSLVANIYGLLNDEDNLADYLPLTTKNFISDNGLRLLYFERDKYSLRALKTCWILYFSYKLKRA